jgi:hypothetical protein
MALCVLGSLRLLAISAPSDLDTEQVDDEPLSPIHLKHPSCRRISGEEVLLLELPPCSLKRKELSLADPRLRGKSGR